MDQMLLRDHEISSRKYIKKNQNGRASQGCKVRQGIRSFVCYQGRHFYIVNVRGGIGCMA